MTTAAEKPQHPEIPLTPVASSQIEAIGYQYSTLAIRFKGGGIYHYAGVSAETYAEFVKAESKGKFFGAEIKGKYGFVRTNPKDKEADKAAA